jgi:hypothetical protein
MEDSDHASFLSRLSPNRLRTCRHSTASRLCASLKNSLVLSIAFEGLRAPYLCSEYTTLAIESGLANDTALQTLNYADCTLVKRSLGELERYHFALYSSNACRQIGRPVSQIGSVNKSRAVSKLLVGSARHYRLWHPYQRRAPHRYVHAQARTRVLSGLCGARIPPL